MTDGSPFWYGGDYNPEQWDEATWHDDVRLMRLAGVNLVSLGIFSWAALEPAPGQFSFGWMDRIIDLLWQNGIHVNLATPTASPPPWLAAIDHETLPVDVRGQRLGVGSRQHFCPNSTGYRAAAASIVTALAERYSSHPALAMWHIHNEYMGHVAECFCSRCDEAFRGWLTDRYGDLEALNRAWGTAFWSQRYGAWDEVRAPGMAPSMPYSGLAVALNNPSQVLDWRRFCSASWLACLRAERAILKRANPDVPATTNHMGIWKFTDYWSWAEHLDLIANDSYPMPDDPNADMAAAMTHDLMRSLAGDKSWMIMESAASAFSMLPASPLKDPGLTRLMSLQAIARGAEGVMFFQWRSSRAGTEKHLVGMLPHAGTQTYVWDDVCQLGRDLETLQPVVGTRTSEPEVALVLDWESWWALEGDFKRSNEILQVELLLTYYRPLYNANIPVAFVHPGADLGRFKVVIAPNLYMVAGSTTENLHRFVAGGGSLVVTCASAVVDENDQVHEGGPLAPLGDLLGLRVEESDGLPAPRQAIVSVTGDAGDYHALRWIDLIQAEGAQTLATIEHRFYAGRPIILSNDHGSGTAYYVGTQPDGALAEWLVDHVTHRAGVDRSLESFGPVESVSRTGPTGAFLFLLNHQSEPVDVVLDRRYVDVLTGDSVEGTVALTAKGVMVLQPAAKDSAG